MLSVVDRSCEDDFLLWISLSMLGELPHRHFWNPLPCHYFDRGQGFLCRLCQGGKGCAEIKTITYSAFGVHTLHKSSKYHIFRNVKVGENTYDCHPHEFEKSPKRPRISSPLSPPPLGRKPTSLLRNLAVPMGY